MTTPATIGDTASRPMPARLSAEDTSDLRTQLEETLAAHEERLAVSRPGDDDLAMAMYRRSEQAATQIRAALTRMEAGRYGICADCEGAIDAERLRAVPHVATCTPCAARSS